MARYVNLFEKKRSSAEKLDYLGAVVGKLAGENDLSDDDVNDIDFFLEKVSDNLGDLDLEDSFASHEGVLSALVAAVKRFCAAATPASSSANVMLHETYEKVILMIVGVIESGPRLRTLVDTLDGMKLLVPLIEYLAAALPLDTSYLTQEIALDILCRLQVFIAQKKFNVDVNFQSVRKALLDAVPLVIRKAFQDPAVGAKRLLGNMRDHLNALNVNSPHVRSFPFAAFGLEVKGPLPLKHEVVRGGWIDMSRDTVNVYVADKDVMIKFPYHDLRNVHCATSANTVQLFFDKLPKHVKRLQQPDGDGGGTSDGDEDGAGKVSSLYVEFATEKEDTLTAVMDVFRQRLSDSENRVTDDRERRKKSARYASATSKKESADEEGGAALQKPAHEAARLGLELVGRDGRPLADEPEQPQSKKKGPQQKQQQRPPAPPEAPSSAVTSPEQDAVPHPAQEIDDEDEVEAADPVKADGGYARHEEGGAPATNARVMVKARSSVALRVERKTTLIAPVKKALRDEESQPAVEKILTPATTDDSKGPQPAAAKVDSTKGTKRMREAEEEATGEVVDDARPAPSKRRPSDRRSSSSGGARGMQAEVAAEDEVDVENIHPNESTRRSTGGAHGRGTKATLGVTAGRGAVAAKDATPVQKAKPPATVTTKGNARTGKQAFVPPSTSPPTSASKTAKMRRSSIGAGSTAAAADDDEEDVENKNTGRKVASHAPKAATAPKAKSLPKQAPASKKRPRAPDPEEADVEEGKKDNEDAADDAAQAHDVDDVEAAAPSLPIASAPKLSKVTAFASWRASESPASSTGDADTSSGGGLRMARVPTRLRGASSSVLFSSGAAASSSFRRPLALRLASHDDDDDDEEEEDEERLPRAGTRPALSRHKKARRDEDEVYSASPGGGFLTDDGEGDDDDYAVGSASRSDDSGVVAMLMKELSDMQRSRALKKRTQMFQSGSDGAVLQVETYLKQWSSFVDASCDEVDSVAGAALEKFTKEMDVISQAIQSNLVRLDAADREVSALIVSLNADVDGLLADLDALDAEQHEDVEERKSTMHSAKKKALTEAKKKAQLNY